MISVGDSVVNMAPSMFAYFSECTQRIRGFAFMRYKTVRWRWRCRSLSHSSNLYCH